jgi:hypothetical protein
MLSAGKRGRLYKASGRDNALQIKLSVDRRHKALAPIQHQPYGDILVHGVPPDAMF